MKATLIQPTIGRVGNKKLERPWTLEPLGMAILAGVTPKNIEIKFYDDRIENIDYKDSTDIVGISVETSTALRAYEIAKHYRDKGIPVVMGGVHPTLLPDEVSRYTDAVVSGHAEKLWPQILNDFRNGKLQKYYKETDLIPEETSADKSIFIGKKYFPASLVEFGRGCPFRCDFCDIPVYFDGKYAARPLDRLVSEIKSSERKLFVVVDDNLGSSPKALWEFCKAITPLKIKWVAQTSVTLAKNEELLGLVAKSGCLGVLLGLESIESENLHRMNKRFNESIPMMEAIRRFHNVGIRIHGSFIVGYDHDTAESVDRLVEFAIKQRLFIANFNPLTPIPRTSLYMRLQKEGRMINRKWWLDYSYRYGDFIFRPANMSPEEMSIVCENAKKHFYSARSILARARSMTNVHGLRSAFGYFGVNMMTRKEVTVKKGAYLGYEKNLLDLLNE
jgi:radical SAM superfamily enzyme YgiQ (UPF0313 family)